MAPQGPGQQFPTQGGQLAPQQGPQQMPAQSGPMTPQQNPNQISGSPNISSQVVPIANYDPNNIQIPNRNINSNPYGQTYGQPVYGQPIYYGRGV